MIKSHADVNDAYESGRFHTQRFFKNIGTTGDGYWQDWGFSSGQPAYDARVGVLNALNPIVARGNDTIWFPDVLAGTERKLHKITMMPRASNSGVVNIMFQLVDIVAYYPLCDGDSVDTQEFDNALPLPRYTDGKGLSIIMVNHVAPALSDGRMNINYTDSDGIDRSVNIQVRNTGLQKVVTGANDLTIGNVGAFEFPLNNEGTGVLRVNSITHITPPGGLHCIYIVKKLATFQHVHEPLLLGDTSGVKAGMEIDFALKDGWRMPVIKDGAHLALFYAPNGGQRNISLFGDFTFIWG